MSFYEALVRRNPDGLSKKAAIQLMLWVYCTLDVLTVEFRQEVLGRQELAEIFFRLSKEGVIKNGDEKGSVIASRAYWESIFDAYLSGQISLDHNFRDKISSFLQN